MTPAVLAVGLLVAAAAWPWWGPRPVPPARVRDQRRGSPDPVGEHRRRALFGAVNGRRRVKGPDVDVASVLTEVTARLRAGATVAAAWDRTLDRRGLPAADGWPDPTADGGPDPTAGGGRGLEGGPGDGGLRGGQTPPGRDPALSGQLAAVRAATRLAHRVGAPLADVLDRCAGGIAEAGRAEAARRIALAGPASTARLLGWLPVGGLLLGWALGADPVATLLDGGAGTAAGLAGLGLLLAGRRWAAALVAAAAAPWGADGEPGGTRP